MDFQHPRKVGVVTGLRMWREADAKCLLPEPVSLRFSEQEKKKKKLEEDKRQKKTSIPNRNATNYCTSRTFQHKAYKMILLFIKLKNVNMTVVAPSCSGCVTINTEIHTGEMSSRPGPRRLSASPQS